MKQIIANVVFDMDEIQTFVVEYIQMRVKVFKSMEGTSKKMIGWNVHHLEPSDIKASSLLTLQ